MGVRRPVWANLALAIAAPASFLLLLELAFAAAGVKPLSLTEDPLVGFASLQPLFVEDPAAGTPAFKTNPAKLTHFNPQSFPAEKPAGAYRIFAVGGSTTYGHPWRDPVSYAGWLRQLLPAADPSRPWEVINAGGISYASYREAKLVEEFTRHRPDLIVVYSGHNEFLEERTYRKAAEIPGFIRETSALLDRTRTYTLMRRALRKARAADEEAKPTLAAEVDDVLARTIGPETYVRDDELRRGVLEHYRVSLERIAALARSAGARVLFLTTPGNERDCSPFKSEGTPGLSAADSARLAGLSRAADSLMASGRAGEAWPLLQSVAQADPRNAAALYRAGQAALALGKHAEAKRLLVQSLEEDVCPLRALPAMHAIVREVAARTGNEVLDVTAALEAKTKAQLGHDILGEPHFVDHVHLSIEEYRAIAVGIVERLAALGVAKPAAGWEGAVVPAVTAKVMAGMGSRELGEGLHNVAKVLNWAGKHEDAARIAAKGLAVDSTGLEAIWSSLFVGAALERQGRSADAVPHYRRAVGLDPTNEMARGYLRDALARAGLPPDGHSGNPQGTPAAAPAPGSPAAKAAALLGEGKVEDALSLLVSGGAAQSGDPVLLTLLGEAQRRAGKAAEAARSFEAALKRNPKEARALLGLARLAEARGDAPEAISLYARALSAAPDLHEARAALTRTLQGMPSTP